MVAPHFDDRWNQRRPTDSAAFWLAIEPLAPLQDWACSPSHPHFDLISRPHHCIRRLSRHRCGQRNLVHRYHKVLIVGSGASRLTLIGESRGGGAGWVAYLGTLAKVPKNRI